MSTNQRNTTKNRRNAKNTSSFDMEDVVKSVVAAQSATAHIPALVRKELEKSWKQLPNSDADRSQKSWMHDPLALQYSLGYKDRRFSLTYDVLKRIAGQLSIISAIINTRCSQVATFAQPYRWTKSLGFVVKHKDPDHTTTPAEVAFIKELEDFIMRCGKAERNPYSNVQRDDFETFLRKMTRDSLLFDQCLPAGTMVEGVNGAPTPIESVEIGDVVRTHTGNLRTVVAKKHSNYTGDLITLKSGSQSISATAEHPFLAITEKWFRLTPYREKNIKPEWVDAENLTEDHYLCYPKPKYSVTDSQDEYFYIKIGKVSKEWVENLPVFNLEVEEDHSYIANGFVSHNCCFEIVPDRLNIPFEFLTVDASTIRIAADDRYVGVNASYHDRSGFVPSMPARFANLYQGREYGVPSSGGKAPISYVQIINGQIENVYSSDELAFGVRNPRSDIYIQGYGYGELEQLITVVTAHLFTELYNRRFFSHGTQAKGILNLKGDNFTQEQLEGFRRQWAAQASGVESSWTTPILQTEGLEWVDLAKSNSEMEFGKWLDYLIKLSTAVYQIDPAELNFDMHGGQQQTPLFESSQEWKIKASRDRGLKPLLRFMAKLLNRNIIDKIDDHFAFEFVGLDELSETEKHQMLVEQISSYKTLNEGRVSIGLPPLPGGDTVLNPVYQQALQQSAQQQPQPDASEQDSADPNTQYADHAGLNKQ